MAFQISQGRGFSLLRVLAGWSWSEIGLCARASMHRAFSFRPNTHAMPNTSTHQRHVKANLVFIVGQSGVYHRHAL